MSELKAYRIDNIISAYKIGKAFCMKTEEEVYLKSEADKVIAEKDAEIRRLKNSIAPKQSDKTLQERLNEVCEKHGVSTLQDLDWAFCESEKRYAKDCIEAVSIIRHSKYKRCLAMAELCESEEKRLEAISPIFCTDKECWEYNSDYWARWHERWLALAEKFKPYSTAQNGKGKQNESNEKTCYH